MRERDSFTLQPSSPQLSVTTSLPLPIMLSKQDLTLGQVDSEMVLSVKGSSVFWGPIRGHFLARVGNGCKNSFALGEIPVFLPDRPII